MLCKTKTHCAGHVLANTHQLHWVYTYAVTEVTWRLNNCENINQYNTNYISTQITRATQKLPSLPLA